MLAVIGLAQIGKAASCCSVANSCVRSAALAFVGFVDFEHKRKRLSFSKYRALGEFSLLVEKPVSAS